MARTHRAGERSIPAVRAPDGTLVYLVAPEADGRTICDDDFVLFPETAPPPLVGSVDHVAQALPTGRMDNFALFYHAVFGFSPDRLWEIPDPYGLVRSRTMVSAEATVRLPLNVSEGRETATGRFLTTYAGAGVHHIALATDDIEHALQQATARGARILAIPANYYDDIGAKWGLSDARIDSLRRHNLLYDQDDNGEFLHAYTDTFDGRFFSNSCNGSAATSNTAPPMPACAWPPRRCNARRDNHLASTCRCPTRVSTNREKRV